jgi:hypothetical protein
MSGHRQRLEVACVDQLFGPQQTTGGRADSRHAEGDAMAVRIDLTFDCVDATERAGLGVA